MKNFKLYALMVSLMILMACASIEPRGLSDWHVKQRQTFVLDVGGRY